MLCGPITWPLGLWVEGGCAYLSKLYPDLVWLPWPGSGTGVWGVLPVPRVARSWGRGRRGGAGSPQAGVSKAGEVT